MATRADSMALARLGGAARWVVLPLLVALAVTLALPERADAACQVWNMNSWGECMRGPVRSAGREALDFLFGTEDSGQGAYTRLVLWVVDMPSFTAGSEIHGLRRTMEAVSFALAGLVVTASMIRFWLAGLSDAGGTGGEAMMGLGRTVGAVMLITAWPWFFEAAVSLADVVTSTVLLAHPGTIENSGKMIAAALGFSVAGAALALIPGLSLSLIVPVVIAVVGTLLLLGVMLVKVLLVMGLGLIYVLMPLALVLAAAPGADWLAPALGRAFVVLLMWPLIQSVVFLLFVMLSDGLTPETDGDYMAEKLAALAMLFLLIKLPFMLTRYAMSAFPAGGGGRGIAGIAAMLVVREAIHAGVGKVTRAPSKDAPKGRKGDPGGPKGGPKGGGGPKPDKRAPHIHASSTGTPLSANQHHRARPTLGGRPMPNDNAQFRATYDAMKAERATLDRTLRPDADEVHQAMNALGPDADRMIQARNHGEHKIHSVAAWNAAGAHELGLAPTEQHFRTIMNADVGSATAGIDRYASERHQPPAAAPQTPPTSTGP